MFERKATPDEYQPIYKNALDTVNENIAVLDKFKARKKPKDQRAHAKKVRELEKQLRLSVLLAEAIGEAYAKSVLETFIDPSQIDDDNYIEKIRRPKVNRLKPGKRNQRDRRLDLPKKFWRWAHRNKKREMSRYTGKPIPIEVVEEWYEEWKNLPPEKQDAYEIAKPIGK